MRVRLTQKYNATAGIVQEQRGTIVCFVFPEDDAARYKHAGPGEPFLCLFQLAEDPGQTKNLATAHPEVASSLQARWDGFRAAREGKTVARDLRLDPSFKALLRKSGYFSAAEDH